MGEGLVPGSTSNAKNPPSDCNSDSVHLKLPEKGVINFLNRSRINHWPGVVEGALLGAFATKNV